MKKIFFCLTLFFMFSFVLAQVSSSTQTSFFIDPDATDVGPIESDSLDSSSDSLEIVVWLILILIVIAVVCYFVFKKQSKGGKKKTVNVEKKKF